MVFHSLEVNGRQFFFRPKEGGVFHVPILSFRGSPSPGGSSSLRRVQCLRIGGFWESTKGGLTNGPSQGPSCTSVVLKMVELDFVQGMNRWIRMCNDLLPARGPHRNLKAPRPFSPNPDTLYGMYAYIAPSKPP